MKPGRILAVIWLVLQGVLVLFGGIYAVQHLVGFGLPSWAAKFLAFGSVLITFLSVGMYCYPYWFRRSPRSERMEQDSKQGPAAVPGQSCGLTVLAMAWLGLHAILVYLGCSYFSGNLRWLDISPDSIAVVKICGGSLAVLLAIGMQFYPYALKKRSTPSLR